jgi:hypothetical protein
LVQVTVVEQLQVAGLVEGVLQLGRGLVQAGGGDRQLIQPLQEVACAGQRAGRGGHGQAEHGLGDVGVVGGAAGAGVDHLEQHDRQLTRRQRPQADRGLIGPDRHPARAHRVQQAACPVCFHAGAGATLAVQHHQQRARRTPHLVCM